MQQASTATAPQQQERFDCEIAAVGPPASPSSTSNDLLATSFSDAIREAAALSKPTMHRAIGDHSADYHTHGSNSGSSSDSGGNASFKTEHADDPAMMAASSYELDRDMMGMLANNWNLNAGPPRAPVANWGFEPTPVEAQALYDPDVALLPCSNQQTALPGSMMMAPSTSAEMTHVVGMSASNPSFVSGAMTSNNLSTSIQPQMDPTTDPFSGVGSGFVMPYQDCGTIPVNDFPFYDGGMYRPAFGGSSAAQFTPSESHLMDNQLGEGSAPFFSNNVMPQAMMDVGPTFQAALGSNNAAPSFNEVAQPPAASMAAINGGFAMPDLSLQEDDDSDWNGSSSGISTVSSSPIANSINTTSSSSTPTNAVAPAVTSTSMKSPTTNKNGFKKPKRIRRLCSVAGCGKRARSQDLCIAHGGGRRCMVEGCEKSSQGGNMCIKHGGGKRCKHPGCDKAAQTNSLCKAHGGGPRCQFSGCTKSSQGGGFCRAHGGGKRCAAEGCNKGTQRGDFCALHGGSRFCEVPGCMRNDRGGGFCAHHGGGKRCSIVNCNRSCRRNGLCSTHLRLLGQESGGKFANVEPAAISAAMPTSTGVTSAV